MSGGAHNLQAFDQQMEGEFLDEARDMVSAVDVLLENVRSRAVAGADAASSIRRDVANLRMLGRSVNFPQISVITHRLEDYVADLADLDPRHVQDIQSFIDKLRGILDGDVPAEATAELARALPARTSVDIQIVLLNIEVMLIIPEKALATIVSRELQACGYRVSTVRTAFEAIEMAVRTKPDMVIAALTLEGLSGVDLACMFAACQKTAQMPFALFTSYALGHPELAGLPPRSAVIRKGPHFGDDLAEALSRFSIT